jgi:hypothetical protein
MPQTLHGSKNHILEILYKFDYQFHYKRGHYNIDESNTCKNTYNLNDKAAKVTAVPIEELPILLADDNIPPKIATNPNQSSIAAKTIERASSSSSAVRKNEQRATSHTFFRDKEKASISKHITSSNQQYHSSKAILDDSKKEIAVSEPVDKLTLN